MLYPSEALVVLSTSSEGTRSWVYKTCRCPQRGWQRNAVADMSILVLYWHPDARSHYCSEKVLSHGLLPSPTLLPRGLRLWLACSSRCSDIYIWWCWDELCTHPTEHSFNEGISFLFLAWLLMDSSLWIKHWLSNLTLRRGLSLQLGTWRWLLEISSACRFAPSGIVCLGSRVNPGMRPYVRVREQRTCWAGEE